MENRFKQLRYKDRYLLDQEISMTQLAEKMQVSKATISKLEQNEDYDAKVSTIHRYKEAFPDVSYDYLMGATATRHKQYNPIEEKLPFGNEFYEHLEALLAEVNKDDEPDPLGDQMTEEELSLLIEAYLSDPSRLLGHLRVIFESLTDLYMTMHSTEIHHWTGSVDGVKYRLAAEVVKFYDSIFPLLENSLAERVDRLYPYSGDTPLFSDDGFMNIPDDTGEEFPFE